MRATEIDGLRDTDILKNARYWFGLLAGCVGLFWSLSGSSQGQQILDVSVTDANGAPTQEVFVMVFRVGGDPGEFTVNTGYTDENGNARFELPFAGVYSIEISGATHDAPLESESGHFPTGIRDYIAVQPGEQRRHAFSSENLPTLPSSEWARLYEAGLAAKLDCNVARYDAVVKEFERVVNAEQFALDRLQYYIEPLRERALERLSEDQRRAVERRLDDAGDPVDRFNALLDMQLDLDRASRILDASKLEDGEAARQLRWVLFRLYSIELRGSEGYLNLQAASKHLRALRPAPDCHAPFAGSWWSGWGPVLIKESSGGLRGSFVANVHAKDLPKPAHHFSAQAHSRTRAEGTIQYGKIITANQVNPRGRITLQLSDDGQSMTGRISMTQEIPGAIRPYNTIENTLHFRRCAAGIDTCTSPPFYARAIG